MDPPCHAGRAPLLPWTHPTLGWSSCFPWTEKLRRCCLGRAHGSPADPAPAAARRLTPAAGALRREPRQRWWQRSQRSCPRPSGATASPRTVGSSSTASRRTPTAPCSRRPSPASSPLRTVVYFASGGDGGVVRIPAEGDEDWEREHSHRTPFGSRREKTGRERIFGLPLPFYPK